MSKKTLSSEIRKELARLNDRIDRKIIRGLDFRKDARRHRELLATLKRIDLESATSVRAVRNSFWRVKSPVRRSLDRGVVGRIFRFHFA